MKTKKIRGRTLLCVVLALVIAMGSVSVVSAEALMITVGAVRLSNTQCNAITDVEFDQVVDSCSATMILQEKYNDSWRTATGVPVTSVSTSGSKTEDLYLYYDFALVKGKLYRIKSIITDTTNSTTYSATRYGPLF